MDYQFKIEGLEQLQAALTSLDDGLERFIIGRGLHAMARVVVKAAKQTAPERTGAYRKSIRARRTSETFRGRKINGGSAAVFVGGPSAPHANFVELGTVKQVANPVLARALVSTKSPQYSALVNATSRELERQVRRLAMGTQTRAITRIITGG